MESSPISSKNFIFAQQDIELITKLMEHADENGWLNEFDKKILALIKEDKLYIKAIIDLVGNYLVMVEQGACADFMRVVMERRLDNALGIDLTKEPEVHEQPVVQLTEEEKKRMN